MGPDDLKQLVLQADRQALCDALAPLNESERAALFDDAIKLYQYVEDRFSPSMSAKELKKHGYADWRCPRWAASLATLAVGDQKFLKNPHQFDCGWVSSDLSDMPHRVLQILEARRPKWLAAFVKREVRQEQTFIAWSVESGLIHSGCLPENDSENFYRRMAIAPLMSTHFRSDAVKLDTLPQEHSSLAKYLQAEPELVDRYIWGLFEHDAGAFNFSHSPWFDALKSLSESGLIDRTRLVSTTAAALSRPSRPKELAGYGKLHESLSPTIEERVQIIEHYFAALNSEHSAVVGVALAALEKLSREKRLDASEFLRHCEGALHIPQKAAPSKAIRLIRALVGQQSEVSSAATEVLAIAIAHERPDVQEAALKVLESMTSHFTPETHRRLLESGTAIASVLKTRLETLLDATSNDTVLDNDRASGGNRTRRKKKGSGRKISAVQPTTAGLPDSEIEDLKARVNAVPEGIRLAADATRAIQEIEAPGESSFVVSITPSEVRRRDPDRIVKPIESLEELIDTVATVVERVDDAMDVERVVDGLSRFGLERPSDFEQRVAPLKKRIAKLDEPYSRNVIDQGARIGFSQLLANWLDMQPVHREVNTWLDLNGQMFRLRCQEIEESWRMQKSPTCRIALPTHRAGWLDPEVLVGRLLSVYVKNRLMPDSSDIAQALLRLTPDGRTSALAILNGLSIDSHAQEYYLGGPTLRYALGEDPEFRDGTAYPWLQRSLMAASHARSLIEPSGFETRIPLADACTNEDFTIRIDGPFIEDPSLPVRLCVLANSLDNTGAPEVRQTDWTHQLEAMIWPANPQPMFMLGCMEGVFDHDLTWTCEAGRLVLFASSVDSKDLRLQATDALVDAISQIRVCPRLVGEQMSRLGDHLMLKRTTEVLTTVSQVSALHYSFVFQALDEYVGRLQSVPKDLHFVLTPLLESALQSGAVPGEAAVTVLKSIKGGSKTAKLARELLSVEADPQKQFASRLQAASAAVDRAERWAKISAATSG